MCPSSSEVDGPCKAQIMPSEQVVESQKLQMGEKSTCIPWQSHLHVSSAPEPMCRLQSPLQEEGHPSQNVEILLVWSAFAEEADVLCFSGASIQKCGTAAALEGRAREEQIDVH